MAEGFEVNLFRNPGETAEAEIVEETPTAAADSRIGSLPLVGTGPGS